MEPIPPTAEAIEKLDRLGEWNSEPVLRRIVQRVLTYAPDCVGLSLTTIEDGITLTMVASSLDIAELDSVQYLDGGPCIDAVDKGRELEVGTLGPLDEERWSMFARASAAKGVRSTLSLVISNGHEVVGGINLYGGTPHAFKDSVGQLAAVLHADAASAIHDADLSFTTRHQAAEAPKVLASQADIAVAIGIIASSRGIDVDSARSQLRTAAAKAGLSEHVVARAVIGFEVGGGFEA